MFNTYFKIAWRNIWRNPGFSVTNLLGLTIGMTCTILIGLWVNDETSWNKFHSNHKNIYQLLVNRDFNGEITTDRSAPFPLGNALKNSFPEIKNSTVDDFGGDVVLKYNDRIIKNRGVTVSPSYIKLFQWEFTKGSAATALSNPENIVLTEATAKALFGNDDPIGKIIKTNNNTNRTVSAVVKNIPANSTICFDVLTTFNYSDENIKRAQGDWINSFTEVFVEVKDGTNIEALNKKISAFSNNKANNANFEYFLHPMDKWRLYSDFKGGKNNGGMVSYVKLFSVIAIIILLMACVNFMNLSTAKSERRAKEVGIRKTLGSQRKQLLLQFYGESMIFSIMAFGLSLIAVYVTMPFFNGLIGRDVKVDLLNPVFILLAIGIIVITGFIAGSYPALYLSSFNPVKVLKGTFLSGKQSALPRKVLVVLQFGISVLLISSTLLVYQQILHVKNRDLGYNPNNLISIPSSPDANKNSEIIRNELLQSNLVAAVTRTSSPITEIWNYTPAPDWSGKAPNANLIMSAMRTDFDFAKTVGTKLVQGRDFMNAPGDSTVMLLNKAAVEAMQLKDPLGMQMRYGPRTYTVVGVTDNVVMSSPYAPVMPMMTMLDKKWGAFYLVRLKDGVRPQTALPKLEAIFKKHNPEYPFDYSFIDQQFNQKFLTEDLIGKLTNIFAGLAIFICCLGLSGLTSFTIEKRFKEIGIRKILGASVQQVLYLISKEFLLLVFLASLISIPVTWWLLYNWLQSYEYRISISIWLFIESCGGVLILTLLVVCLNSIRAATTSPVKNLRTE